MKKLYFNISGMNYRFGNEFLEPGMRVRLEKEKDNEYDTEAIKVSVEGLGQIGYVANSFRTVVGECMSAGRIYDKIGDEAGAAVVFKIPQGAVCVIDENDVTATEGLDLPFC